MKCIKNVLSGDISRVSDSIAEIKTKNKAFIYIPKSEWKANRPTTLATEVEKTPEQEQAAIRRAEKKKIQRAKKNYGKF